VGLPGGPHAQVKGKEVKRKREEGTDGPFWPEADVHIFFYFFSISKFIFRIGYSL
jgi:hypothetical protein